MPQFLFCSSPPFPFPVLPLPAALGSSSSQCEAAARSRDTTVAAGAGESIDARRLLDGMPPGQPAKRAVPPVAGGGGSIESLPDGVLEHILGFLPSAEAVQTSVLARRWRHLWKSATGLRIGCLLAEDPMSVEEHRSLVNHLLVLRQGSPLEACDFTIGDFSGGDDVRHVNLWFRQAVICRARMLRICMISSDSVKYLHINASVLSSDSRIHIYAPNLASLRLVYLRERTPMLYSMPSLVEAVVTIDEACTDHCNGANYETFDSCILEHSPVLEKLTLQLGPEMPQPKVEMKLCVSSTKRSAAISEYLKKVELKCEVVDDSVLKVLKFLSTYNIYSINVSKY
ncbi:unnamed protein product [Miscanthus lutarioriparius]|uniref:F-box domain-containing protein n=1 Tax=Miscanthus lutarioriparius TaxID=422564 RepID=A0A811QDD2_9POAL|nr:unnamed protein product [Miscanthus lutarioriparius]